MEKEPGKLRVHVTAMGGVPAEPMSREEVSAANKPYFDAITEECGKFFSPSQARKVARIAHKQYLDSVLNSADEPNSGASLIRLELVTG